MKLVFSEQAWEDYLYWQKTDKKILVRINSIIKDITRLPFEGIGKPEPLKHALSGYWSRRINDEHRMVYKVSDDSVWIAQLRFHY
ncbi:MAG: Txe/YoeB family addiction module toxin [Gammaproteobacteria bacterium]|nr:Txe/YoeB family addiction module toxin [Gammaproteobacteria bacterium]MBK6583113.1 Txe/YoeB family addiction module toxin [Gammaproteobacteria bacterium]MBK7519248.1 Txe/YoeB family addiction module toxin [Gammaproteobacteria bacterium]MBK9666131.1 Txe/YoeB family addiction module toxin [Gammaproteobacteria bacterium]